MDIKQKLIEQIEENEILIYMKVTQYEPKGRF